MEKKPPVIAIILTILSFIPPMIFLIWKSFYFDSISVIWTYTLSPILNLIAVAPAVVSIILCQKSVRKVGEYLSTYILLVINSALIIINLILIAINYFLIHLMAR